MKQRASKEPLGPSAAANLSKPQSDEIAKLLKLEQAGLISGLRSAFRHNKRAAKQAVKNDPSKEANLESYSAEAVAFAETLKSNALFANCAHLCTVEKVAGVAVQKCGDSASATAESGGAQQPGQQAPQRATAKAKQALLEATPEMKQQCQKNLERAVKALEMQDNRNLQRYEWVVKAWSELYPLCSDAFGFADEATGRKKRRRGSNDMIVAWRLVHLLRHAQVLEYSNPERQPEKMRETVSEICDKVDAMICKATDSEKGGSSLAPYVRAMRPGDDFEWPKECKLSTPAEEALVERLFGFQREEEADGV